MTQLYSEHYKNSISHQKHFVMPVGLLLVIDAENGGDITAQELVKRFNLLHCGSQNIIDFYFLGWEWVDTAQRSNGIRFNLNSFTSGRDALAAIGVSKFGGNADLILVDAHCDPFVPNGITLNFQEAIYVNLSNSVKEGEISSVGEFLEVIVDAAKRLRRNPSYDPSAPAVWSISDTLGLATAKQSILDFILKKWGEVIGAKKLKAIATRNIGPNINLYDLPLDVVSQGSTAFWEQWGAERDI
jgi:hypothetical protein